MTRQSTSQIVVITDRQDAHIAFVQPHLPRPMIIIDPQAVIEGVELSFELEKGHMVPVYDGVRLNAVKGVWYRKPRDVLPEQLNVAEGLLSYAVTTLQSHTIQIVAAFRDAVWISGYYALRRSSNKSWQLEVASQIGFNTPRTLMTSSPEKAAQFIASEGECIVKAQAAYSPEMKYETKSFLTRKISKRDMPSLQNLHLAPAIFQQYIDAAFDVRVTVVGTKIFPAIIRVEGVTNDQLAGVRDWRMGHFAGEMVIEPYEHFPAEVAAMCIEHNKRLGLNFGAIDLVMDRQGGLWFLENNPNGQWGFIERQTGQQIGKAIAELLSAGRVSQVYLP